MEKQRIQEVFSDELFVRKLAEVKGAEELRAALKEKGIDVSGDQFGILQDEIGKLAEKAGQGGALSQDQLNGVAGGAFKPVLGTNNPYEKILKLMENYKEKYSQ